MPGGPSVAIQGVWMAAQDHQGRAEAEWLPVRRRRRRFRPEPRLQAAVASCLPGARQRHPAAGVQAELPVSQEKREPVL